MAPRSPTQAFDPTPALEHNKFNYSPFDDPDEMLSIDNYSSSAFHKGVRFSESSTAPIHRAHSIATENVPLLPAIASASIIPRAAFRITNPTPGIDITAYIENCRNLNEQLRQAHEAERRAWNIERTALKSRIAELEFKVNRASDTKRRSSNESHFPIAHHAPKPDTRAMYQSGTTGLYKSVTESAIPTVAPVWQGPESTPPTTRVFKTEETNGHHLPSISEDDSFPSLSKEVSPSTAVDNAPVPIEQLDSTLDGITLRSAALTSSFEAKITSPQFGSAVQSPSAKPEDTKSNLQTLHIDAYSLLSPLDEKLKRHAGHTPMAFHGEAVSNGASDNCTEISTPIAEQPIAPAPTTRPRIRPTENSDSYFSTVSDSVTTKTIQEDQNGEQLGDDQDALPPQFESEDDKPLKGPLMLDSSANTKAASSFLDQLDAKLEAVRETSPDRRQSFVSVASTGDAPAEVHQQPVEPIKRAEPDDDMPKLRLKKSTNFGSAYGFRMPGRM